MQYIKNYTLKAFFNYFLLWTTLCIGHTISISATQSELWIDDNVEEKTNITTAFNTQKNKGLHLFSHGKSGELLLEGEWKNAKQIAAWLKQQRNIQQQIQLNVYGCEFAKGQKGKAAAQYLEETLGVCVAASNDITGIDGDWELEVGYSATNLVVENYKYNLQCANPLPTASVYALAASCTNGVPNDDAYLQISTATDATHYNFITGNDYTAGDADIANATAFDIANDLPLQFGTLANPSGSQDYTIRVFNTTSDCFTDITVTLMEQDCMASCSCDEYIYLNDPLGGLVHKFQVNTDGSLTEILNNGNTWYPGTGVSELPNPHGLGVDLNGFLYIGEAVYGSNEAHDNDIRRLTCDGELKPSTEFAIPIQAGVFNIVSQGNSIFFSRTYNTSVEQYDACTGTFINEVCFNENTWKDWALFLDDEGNFYAATSFTTTESRLYKFTIDDFGSGVCVDPFITTDDGTINIGDNELPENCLFGVVTDGNGNIYVVEKYVGGVNSLGARIIKYDSDGNLLAMSPWDLTEGDGGWFHTTGIVYSETSGLLYTSSESSTEDCAYIFDTDLNPIESAVGPAPNTGNNSKGIAILNECCPSPNRQTINQTYCVSGSNEQLFLNDLFPCDGIICEGQWTPADAAATAIYNDCDQSISAGIAAGCYSFTKGSEGLENYPKCGAFELNFNLEILELPSITMSADQTVCSGEIPAELSVTTTSGDIQWQISTTSCTDGFTNIEGATATTYTPNAVTETTYYRAMVTETANCSSGNCAFESDCISINISGTAPTFTIDGATCDAGNTTYTIDFTSDGTVTSTAGIVAGNQVIDIPASTDATITAMLNGCTTEETVVSPDCGTNCPSTKCMQVTVTKMN